MEPPSRKKRPRRGSMRDRKMIWAPLSKVSRMVDMCIRAVRSIPSRWKSHPEDEDELENVVESFYL